MLILRWSSAHFAEQATSAFSHLHRCLSVSLDGACSGLATVSDETKILHKQLLRESVSLNAIYSQAAFELRVGRVGGTNCGLLLHILTDERLSQIHQTVNRHSRERSARAVVGHGLLAVFLR